jgi:dTDP-alpha-D-glucuronic acid decarboxylase
MMKNKRVLVTGAAGFVGSHLVDKLLELGNQVIGFDIVDLGQSKNLQLAADNNRFKYVQGDIRDIQALRKAFSSDLQTVFHLASVVGVKKYMEDPFLLVDITLGGTRNVAQLALEFGTQILYTSTSEVFGRNPKVPWAEDDDRVLGSTQVDRWSYSTSKACCEHLLWGLHRSKKIPVTVVRYFNAYGPRQSPIFVVSQSVHKVLNDQQPLLYDGGGQTRCFTYIDDAVRGTIMAASHAKGNGEIFNIGNNKETTMKEAVELVIQHSGKDIQWQGLDTKKHYGKVYEDIERRVPAVSKAKEILGWQAEVSHSEGIRRTVEWAKQNTWWLKG